MGGQRALRTQAQDHLLNSNLNLNSNLASFPLHFHLLFLLLHSKPLNSSIFFRNFLKSAQKCSNLLMRLGFGNRNSKESRISHFEFEFLLFKFLFKFEFNF